MISLGQLLNPQPPAHGHAESGRAANTHTANEHKDRGVRNSDHSRRERPDFTIHDLQKAQKTMEHQLTSKMDAQMALIKPEAAALLAPTSSEAGYSADDFSPEAVSERVMGFIESRIEAEREAGASDEELQSMFGEALKGLEQGLKEAKEVITALDMFDGEIKDTFFETVALIDERMTELEAILFEASEGSVPEVRPSSGEEGRPIEVGSEVRREVSKTLDLDKAFSSIPRGNERYSAQSNALFFSQDNQFDMEVTTQDGDVVTIHVGAGESVDYRSGSLETPDGTVSGFDLGQSSYHEISFSVEGDLDEGEMAALNDLFSQVNDIADTFYAGDVGGAFEQALAVGYDSEELAAFAVNMTHSEVVAVTSAYHDVAAIDTKGHEPVVNPLQSMMDKLSDFSSQVRSSYDALLENPNKPSNQGGLYVDLLAELVPKDAPEEANPVHDRFRNFLDRVLT